MTASPGLMSSLAPKNAITEMEKLLNALKNPPAKSKDEKGFKHNGWHSCTKLWIETTFRVGNKLFLCLICSTTDEPKFWCFLRKPQIGTVKRHYKNRHANDPITKQLFPEIMGGDYSSTQFNKDILNWIVTNNHPFSMADEPNLREIFQKLNPHMKLLHRKQLVEKYLPILTQEMEAKVFIYFFRFINHTFANEMKRFIN